MTTKIAASKNTSKKSAKNATPEPPTGAPDPRLCFVEVPEIAMAQLRALRRYSKLPYRAFWLSGVRFHVAPKNVEQCARAFSGARGTRLAGMFAVAALHESGNKRDWLTVDGWTCVLLCVNRALGHATPPDARRAERRFMRELARYIKPIGKGAKLATRAGGMPEAT